MEGSSTPHRQIRVLRGYFGNPCLLLALRLIVGLAFVVASVEKIADPGSFASSISNYRLLPDSLVLLPATFLPWMELLCGFCLFFGVMVRGSALLVASMLVVFTAALLLAIFRGLDIACGCFTQDPGAAVIGWWKIAENAGFFLASILLLLGGGGAVSLESYLKKQSWRNHSKSPHAPL